MRSFTTVILVLLVLAGLLAGYVATRPTEFRVERSTVIEAPPERIFPLINDFDEWLEWSPYEKKDPSMQRERRGSLAGPGSVYAWDGNQDIGKGWMEIIEAVPPSRVEIDLNFERPMAARNRVVFSLEPEGSGNTRVTWAMSGRNSFLGKLAGVVMDMDTMVGRDFEAGLAELKARAEGSAGTAEPAPPGPDNGPPATIPGPA